MSNPPEGGRRPPGDGSTAWPDLAIAAALFLAGGAYLWNARHWAATVYVGGAQYGDAQFWWDGALHFSQGIVRDNPNLLYRMGYAAFGGTIAAVFGPNYLVFHKILLAVFLALAVALYRQMAGAIGRIAAAAAAALLVFNPYTAEWLAVSSSDSLGMILNLAALLALGRRRPALFGTFLAAASLTRPLMTLMIAPAMVAALGWASDGRRGRAGRVGPPSPTGGPSRPALPGRLGEASRSFPWAAIVAMLLPFFALTLAWMALMGVLSGNFAISGASQDSSIFYAASDPQIQVWRPDMYIAVEAAARRRFHTPQLTARQVNAEFWTLTLDNYRRHWRYHLRRLPGTVAALAGFTPERATAASPATNRLRWEFKLGFTLLLAASAAVRRRWRAAGAAAILGLAWLFWAPFQAIALLAASAFGLFGWCFRGRARRPVAPSPTGGPSRPALPGRLGEASLPFIWAAYWWIGVAALYLTGGTWGPPLGPTIDLNALGYRLGFQFFFAADILIVGGLAMVARSAPAASEAAVDPGSAVDPGVAVYPGVAVDLRATAAAPPAESASPARLRPASAWPGGRRPPRSLPAQILHGAGVLGGAALAAILLLGAGIIARRMVQTSRTAPAPYPDLTALSGLWPKAAPVRDIAHARAAIDAETGAPLALTAMSSGFVWNLDGQRRCMLMLYQQTSVRPVQMMPNWLLAEFPAQVPEGGWRMRQGAWLLRSFPDAPVASNRPYYFEVAAVQGFVPLASDGRSYELDRAVRFALAKYASQLAADHELEFRGATPDWVHDSGPEKYPRRFALRGASPARELTLDLDLRRARGNKTLRFGWRVEGGAGSPPVRLAMTGAGEAEWVALEGRARRPAAPAGRTGPPYPGEPPQNLWQSTSGAQGGGIAWAEVPLTACAAGRLSCPNLPAGAILWLYEFILTADDYGE